jgi:class III poly(R)-hydroxyalkanoic acid synthase PhaE subunit
MNPFEYIQTLAELWSRSGNAFVTAQQSLFSDMTSRMAKAAGGDKGPAFPQVAMPDAEGLGAAGRAFSELWSSAAQVSSTLTRTLQTGEKPDPIVVEMLGKIFDPRLWFTATDDMDETLQRMAEGPRLADLWNVERKFAAMFNAWVAMRRHSLEHNTVMLDAWIRAVGAFAKELNERAERGETLESWREVLAVWVEIANRVLLETQRSEAFLKTQRNVLKASTDLRLAQQEVAAFYSEMFGYPTRAELDDVYKTVTELRRDLRSLQHRLRQPRAAPAPAQGPAEAAERPKPARSRRAPAEPSPSRSGARAKRSRK